MTEQQIQSEFSGSMARLVEMSIRLGTDPFRDIVWPPALPEDAFWMGPELLTVAGTPYAQSLTKEQLIRLARWESVHLYSLIMHGERDLNATVIEHIHRPGFEEASEYFHHFIEEENRHMWFFSQFCLRYGGKIYPRRPMKFVRPQEPTLYSYLAFAQIMIFEELGDFFNVRVRDDTRVPKFIRTLSQLHHQDEARHLAMARKLLCRLHQRMALACGPETVLEAEHYLKRYMQASVESLYNPAVYRDAGIGNEYRMRAELLRHPARHAIHAQVLARVTRFFNEAGLFSQKETDDVRT